MSSGTFLNSLSAEWLKTRRSAASWLVIGGAFFMPLIFMGVAMYADPYEIYHQVLQEGYWQAKSKHQWNTVAIMLLPLGTVLGASLITNIEYKNNGWKSAFTTPQPVAYLYFAKLFIIIARMVQFILLFHLGIYLSSVFPALLYRGIPYPVHPYPLLKFLKLDCMMLVAILPVIALQYVLSIQFRNLFIPLAIGLVCWLISLIAIQWKYIYLNPYVYAPSYFAPRPPLFNVEMCAVVSFLVILAVGFVAFSYRRDRSG